MSRRKSAAKREILPDSKYNNLVVAKCINVVMWDIIIWLLQNVLMLLCGTAKKKLPKISFMVHWIN